MLSTAFVIENRKSLCHSLGRPSRSDFVQVEFDSMKEIKEIHIQGNKCLAIDYINGKTVVHEDRITTMVFPNISNFDEAMETLLSLWEKTEKKKG